MRAARSALGASHAAAGGISPLRPLAGELGLSVMPVRDAHEPLEAPAPEPIRELVRDLWERLWQTRRTTAPVRDALLA